MKLIAQVKLLPDKEQAGLLKNTLETANRAANAMSGYAWEHKVFRQYDLHHALYYATRESYGLSAQMTVRVLAKVSDAYKLDRKSKRAFRPHGSIAYDKRILTWRMDKGVVSLWTTGGRQTVRFVAGERQVELLQTQRGEADLVYRWGKFYLYQTCEVEEPPLAGVDEYLGVDLGIVNVAVTSDGDVYSGEEVDICRQWYAKRRATLQSVGTRSAKRRLKQLRGRQQRFQKNTNHCISKQLVATAQGTGRGIALEDLTGIRRRVTVRRGQRARHHNWSFAQLQQFVIYKAVLAGVPVQLVDPRNTSRTCPLCGHCAKENRRTRDDFLCTNCGHAAPADWTAAINIADRVLVNAPMVSAPASAV